MHLNGQDDPPGTDTAAPAGVDAASWREFQHRVQQRRFQSLAERARERSDAARRELEALQTTLDEARQLRPGAAHLRELEAVARAATASFAPHRHTRAGWIVGILLFFLLTGAAVAAAWSFSRTSNGAAASGSLRVESDPPGATVSIDGTRRGVTPLALPLRPGQHELLVQSSGRTTRSTVSVRAGADMVHAVHFADAPAASEAPIAAPVTVGPEIQAQVEPASAPAIGWVTLATPFPVTVRDRTGRVLGTSALRRIPITAGDQQVELANADLGYSSRQAVRIEQGATTRLQVAAPTAPLSLNAIPWAEVSIDGRAIGETPLGDLTETIGEHQLEFRHPELGTKRITVRVTLKEPTRVSVDMRVP